VLTVSEHIAIVQRAQAIAATDHGALVRVGAELAAARAELKQLRRWSRRPLPAISGWQGPWASVADGTMRAWQSLKP
jgi:hypothetical protein